MNKIIMWIFVVILLLGIVRAAELNWNSVRDIIDFDDDGICDPPKGDVKYTTYKDVILGCSVMEYGDLCLGTKKGSTVSHFTESAGCSPSEIQAFVDYWSTKIGQLVPDRVKMNWLLDQQYIKIYQPIEFTPNIVIRTDKEIASGPEITDVNFYCTGDHFGGLKKIDTDNDLRTITLEITLSRFSSQELTSQNILDINNDGKSGKVGEVKIGCIAYVYQKQFEAVRKEDGTTDKKVKRVYPPEENRFEFFIPIETLALQPPDSALQAGIKTSQAIIDGVDVILPKIEKARKISGTICTYSIGITLVSKIIKPLEDFGNWWWYGVLGSGTTYKTGVGSKTGGWIGGKAFCRYYACPNDWCPLLQETKLDPASITVDEKKTYETLIKRLEEARDKTTDNAAKDRYQKSIDQLKNPTYLDRINFYPKEGVASIQDSLILSVGCQCISGVELNLWRVKRIMEEWNKCLKIALEDKEYVSYCEKYLSQNICQYVVGEMSALKQINPIQKGLNWISKKVSDLFGETSEQRSAVSEATDVRAEVNKMESGIEASKTFISNELMPIASSGYKGKMGYGDLGTVFCELALYQRIPQLDFLKKFNVESIQWKTTITGQFNKKIAYIVPDSNQKVYDYEISWTIIAGEDNFLYTITLENEAGVTQRLLRGSGVLYKAGDVKSDYIQITDERDFTKICFDTPRDINRRHCFYEGDFREGSPVSGIEITNKDSDSDGLPDDWEKANGCAEKQNNDKDWCKDLLAKGYVNYLDPKMEDSNGDGVKDGDEDPDGDGVNNYLEYKSGLDPNVPGGTSTGGLAKVECSIENNLNVGVDTSNTEGGFYKFTPGEDVRIKMGAVGLSSGTEAKDLVVLGEIENGKYAFFERLSYPLSNIANGGEFTLWTVPNDIKTGQYDLRISLSKPKDFYGQNICSVKSSGKLAMITIPILIINSADKGCVDSGMDRWNKGTCISGGVVNTDKCFSETLVTEGYCDDNDKCVTRDLPCSTSESTSEKCTDGKCVTATVWTPPQEEKEGVKVEEITVGEFVWPLPTGNNVITSCFGSRNLNGVQDYHKGMDISANEGTSVYVIADGEIVEKGTISVKVKHGGDFASLYTHVRSIEKKVGDKVSKGEKIAEIGSQDEYSTGHHLDLKIFKNNEAIDPLQFYQDLGLLKRINPKFSKSANCVYYYQNYQNKDYAEYIRPFYEEDNSKMA